MRTMLASVMLIALGAAVPAGQATPSADDLARKIQAHYDTVKDFDSDFTQVYQSKFAKAQPESRGQVRVKKPGRMRWAYTSPNKTVTWSDGVTMNFYDFAAKRGEEGPLIRGSDASPSMLFLLDRGNLVRDFTASLAGDQPAGEWRLTLTPKRPDPDVKSLMLVVDRATYKLRGMSRVDAQGATDTYTFPNLKENVGLSDKDVSFEFPKGTHFSR